MSTKFNPMSGRKAALYQLADAVNKYLATPQGKTITAKLPKVTRAKPALQARRSVMDHKTTVWLSPVYLRCLDDVSMAFEVYTGRRPSRGVIFRYALASLAERLAEAVKDRDAIHAEAVKLAGHADAR